MKFVLRCLFCLILFCCVIAVAQEDSLNQKVADIIEKGAAAYKNKEYQKTIDAYLEATTYPETKDSKAALFYDVGCSYSLLGDAEKAFEYLDSAIAAGYTDFRWLKADSDFAFLRENRKNEFEELIDRARAAREQEVLIKSPISVLEYDNYNGPLDIEGFAWEDLNRPELDTLRRTYQLQNIVEGGKTEFEKMTRLLNWVSTRWEHDGTKMAPNRTALAILRDVDQGKRYCCANYADVLIDCLKALGYPTRFAGLRTDDAAYYSGGGHGCLEVWSNQYQKWILLDGQNNAWWEHDGMPLNAYECHQLFTGGKEDALQFVGQNLNVDYSQMKSFWSAYFYRVICYWMGTSYELFSDRVQPGLLYQNRPQNSEITDQYEKVYPPLNRTKITLRIDPEGSLDSMNVILDHTMPYFDHYLVRIDESEWKDMGESFPWALHEGINTVEARAINSAGIEGRTSRIVLQNNLRHEVQ